MTATIASSPQWHAITPQTRPLTLSILELTPLALTLSLTLAPPVITSTAGPSTTPKTRRKYRQRRNDSDDEATAVEGDDDSHSQVPGSWPAPNSSNNFRDLLSHGVVVSVNGQPWNRIVAHVSDLDEEDVDGDEHHGPEEGWDDDDEPAGEEAGARDGGEDGLTSVITRRRPRRARFGNSAGNASRPAGDDTRRKPELGEKSDRGWNKDKAMVVVYGLSPGKEYEIELRVVGSAGQEGPDGLVPSSPSNTLLTPSRANSLRSRSIMRSRSNSAVLPPDAAVLASHAASHDTTVGTSSPVPVLSPSDAQAAQLRHLIAAAHSNKEHVSNQIKDARRASQRSEAALRLEIDTVKKAIDKSGSVDMRAKQKTLALQEQVKQGWAGAEGAEKEADAIEQSMNDREAKLESAKVEVDAAKSEFQSVKDREEDVREREKRMRLEEDRKLADIILKVEKLRVKKERKEAEKAELEKRLDDLDRQREAVEKRNEEEKTNRRTAGYWQRGWDHDVHHALEPARPLSAHPSLNNLSTHGGYASGSAYRPRGAGPAYQSRFPSAGNSAIRPNQPLAAHTNVFHPAHPAASPVFRPARPIAMSTSLARAPSSGVNASALPFHPSQTYSSQSSIDPAGHHTTSLLPPQLQHRIYPPNVRPRPMPNFHPPPSVQAEQGARLTNSPTMLSPPSFPPLPSQTSGSPSPPAGKLVPSGPSLASIVTRAVLSPTSALAAQALTAPMQSHATPPQKVWSSGNSAQSPTSPYGPVFSQSANDATPPLHPPIQGPGSRVVFGAPPLRRASGPEDFPPLSPTGPWIPSAPHAGGGMQAMQGRASTSPAPDRLRETSGSLAVGSGGLSGKSTGDSG